MAKKYDIKYNQYTDGLCCFFHHDGREFFADLSDIPFSIDFVNECMIFPAKDGRVTDWSELYCKRNIEITEGQLARCIDEFKKEYDDNKR